MNVQIAQPWKGPQAFQIDGTGYQGEAMELEVIHRSPQGSARPTPLLFVHGKWHGSWCWDEYFLSYFAGQCYGSYALSPRGHGKSEGRIPGSCIADYVNDVAQVAGQFDQPPVIIGHWMGGFITQKYWECAAARILRRLNERGI